MTDKKKEVIGFDLVDFVTDYTKTTEENWAAYRQKYFEVYGEYPPEPGKMIPTYVGVNRKEHMPLSRARK
jgi:hypothetical protein